MRVRFEVFRSSFESWRSLFSQAAEFASGLSPERLITITTRYRVPRIRENLELFVFPE